MLCEIGEFKSATESFERNRVSYSGDGSLMDRYAGLLGQKKGLQEKYAAEQELVREGVAREGITRVSKPLYLLLAAEVGILLGFMSHAMPTQSLRAAFVAISILLIRQICKVWKVSSLEATAAKAGINLFSAAGAEAQDSQIKLGAAAPDSMKK
jgi:hypothetical protein